MTDENSVDSPLTNEEELRKRISLFLHRNFPQIQLHGGDAAIEALDPDAGTVTIRLGGACSGCGISPMTIQALKHRLLEDIPELTEVNAHTGQTDASSAPSQNRGENPNTGSDPPF